MPEHLPLCFAPCRPDTVRNELPADVHAEEMLKVREKATVEKDKMWTCFALTRDSDVEHLYRELSEDLAVDGKLRYLIVAQVGSAAAAAAQ